MYSKFWLHSDEAMVQLFALSSAIWIRIQHTDPAQVNYKKSIFINFFLKEKQLTQTTWFKKIL